MAKQQKSVSQRKGFAFVKAGANIHKFRAVWSPQDRTGFFMRGFSFLAKKEPFQIPLDTASYFDGKKHFLCVDADQKLAVNFGAVTNYTAQDRGLIELQCQKEHWKSMYIHKLTMMQMLTFIGAGMGLLAVLQEIFTTGGAV